MHNICRYDSKEWRALINKEAQASVVSSGSGEDGYFTCVILDTTRYLYAAAVETFNELTFEVSRLWDEVKALRKQNALMRAELHIRSEKQHGLEQRVRELESEREKFQGLHLSGWRGMQLAIEHDIWDPLKLTAKVYELGSFGGGRTGKVLAVKDIVFPPIRITVAEHKKDTHNELHIRAVSNHRYVAESIYSLSAAKPWYYVEPKIKINFGTTEAVAVDQFGTVLASAVLPAQRAQQAAAWGAAAQAGHGHNPYVYYRPGTNLFGLTGASNSVDATVAKLEKWQHYRSVPKNHMKKWIALDDAKLLQSYKRGGSLCGLANSLDREWEAILYRLARLAKWPESSTLSPKFLRVALAHFFDADGKALESVSTRISNSKCPPLRAYTMPS